MGARAQQYDVIVVGGGPVGLSFALALVRFMPGVRVALCDARALVVPGDERASALAAGVTRVFEALGIWPAMAASAEPIRAMRITDSGTGDLTRPVFLRFDGDVLPGRPFAHMVPNRATIGALLDELGAVDQYAPVTVSGYAETKAGAQLQLGDGRTLEGSLIVAADGARSALREMAGIKTVGHDYQRSGIVTTIGHELDHNSTAFEHFRPVGPFASLPLPNRRSSLVWTERHEDAVRFAALPPEELAETIEAVMGSSLGAVALAAPVQVFPLRMQLARSFIAPRLALIGDAAHVVHPVAGQGMNLGLKDIAALAETLVEAMRIGLDPGSAGVLERYQRWRRFDTALMAHLGDAMVRGFSNDIPAMRAARDFGLGLVDRLPAIKTGLIRHAAAIAPMQPRLLDGEAI